jgi:hypothetical protein
MAASAGKLGILATVLSLIAYTLLIYYYVKALQKKNDKEYVNLSQESIDAIAKATYSDPTIVV